MKRVIEFRGINPNTGKIEGVGSIDWTFNEVIFGGHDSDASFPLDEVTLFERTPFNATDGTPIFEGMMVKATMTDEYDRDMEVGRVEMDKRGQFVVCNMECFPRISGLSLAWGGWETLEIVED